MSSNLNILFFVECENQISNFFFNEHSLPSDHLTACESTLKKKLLIKLAEDLSYLKPYRPNSLILSTTCREPKKLKASVCNIVRVYSLSLSRRLPAWTKSPQVILKKKNCDNLQSLRSRYDTKFLWYLQILYENSRIPNWIWGNDLIPTCPPSLLATWPNLKSTSLPQPPIFLDTSTVALYRLANNIFYVMYKTV